MRPLLAVPATITALALACAVPAAAQSGPPSAATIRDCLVAAGNAHRESPGLLVILLNVEGGRLGEVSPNTNGTVDIGPMQVNDIWVPKVARHWGASREAAYRALRDSFCANVEAGAWILRLGLDEARGDFWEGVGYYHSHEPGHKRTYLASVLRQAMRLEAQASGDQSGRKTTAAPPSPRVLAALPASRTGH